jgi:hypothetical protein
MKNKYLLPIIKFILKMKILLPIIYKIYFKKKILTNFLFL